jgi:hypothetical protein
MSKLPENRITFLQTGPTYLNQFEKAEIRKCCLKKRLLSYHSRFITKQTVAMVFAKIDVAPGAINFVGMDGGGITTQPISVCLSLFDQIGRLVISIPAQTIQKAVTINRTYRYLCPKFRSRSCFAPFNRTYMRF